jgi:hypothetical protein
MEIPQGSPLVAGRSDYDDLTGDTANLDSV